jgi:riboflavin kinase/FMN adenylyltransferase
VGDDFCFGKGRGGDAAYLEKMQSKYCYVLHALEPIILDGVRISSTRVRKLLQEGEISHAEAMLGHSFWLAGQAIGRLKGCHALRRPTIYLELPYGQVVPAEGAYSVRIRFCDQSECGGICTISETTSALVEPALSDFDGNLIESNLTVRFVRRLHGDRTLHFLRPHVATHDVVRIFGTHR